MVTTGGTSLKDDIMRLYQPVHLLVGTPGRILDLTKKGVCVLNDCNVLVMDEVNRSHLKIKNIQFVVDKVLLLVENTGCLNFEDIWEYGSLKKN